MVTLHLELTGSSIDAITLDSTFISGDAAVSVTVSGTQVIFFRYRVLLEKLKLLR